jgi:hypothetical protein
MSRRLSFVVLVVLALSLLMVLVMANKADGTCLCCKYRTKYQGIATASCISDLSKLRKLGEQYACPDGSEYLSVTHHEWKGRRGLGDSD